LSATIAHHQRPRHRNRGFTLLECMMAVSILLTVVMAVTSAITSGQQHAYEAQQRVAAAMAADELLGRITCDAYANIGLWNNYNEPVGQMKDLANQAMPGVFAGIGRRATVSATLITASAMSIKVRGVTVRVVAFDRGNRTLADVSRFVPEPQS
jgi:prepilin-type N-terminal cleavage/methylation domain-containing protein